MVSMFSMICFLEILDYFLFSAEFFMSLTVWAGTADKLDTSGSCYFGKRTTCSAIIFFAVSAWLTLLVVGVLLVLSRCFEKVRLRRRTGAYIFTALTVVWLLISLVAGVASPGPGLTGTARAVVGLSWINTICHGASAGIAFLLSREEVL